MMNKATIDLIKRVLKMRPKTIEITTGDYHIIVAGRDAYMLYPFIFVGHASERFRGKLINDNAELIINLDEIDIFKFK